MDLLQISLHMKQLDIMKGQQILCSPLGNSTIHAQIFSIMVNDCNDVCVLNEFYTLSILE